MIPTYNLKQFTYTKSAKRLVSEASDLQGFWGQHKFIDITGIVSTVRFKMDHLIESEEREVLVWVYTSGKCPGLEVHILND